METNNYLSIPDNVKIRAIQNVVLDFGWLLGGPSFVLSDQEYLQEYDRIMHGPVPVDGVIFRIRGLVRREVDKLPSKDS